LVGCYENAANKIYFYSHGFSKTLKSLKKSVKRILFFNICQEGFGITTRLLIASLSEPKGNYFTVRIWELSAII